MWEEYFPNAEIYGFDIDENCKQYEEGRVKIIIGDQSNTDHLSSLPDDFDIIIDDGSHVEEHVLKSLDYLFQHKLKIGGIYVIEDLLTSPDHHKDLFDTIMKFNDAINYSPSDYRGPWSQLNHFGDNLDYRQKFTTGLHLYRYLTFIDKNRNPEDVWAKVRLEISNFCQQNELTCYNKELNDWSHLSDKTKESIYGANLCYGGEPNYLEKLGTDYGSWVIPNSISLSSDSVVYSAGVGEDISFDLLLQSKYNCNITLIDPTSRAKNHFDEVSSFYNTNDWKFSGDVQSDYKLVIENLKPNLDKFQFLQVGLWKCKDRLRFYKHDNPLYVSQTLIPDMFGKNYDEVSVNSVKNIMQENGHTKIDLLKIDVEGAEIDVINQMINDKIYPKYICMEMDLYSKGKDQDNLTSTLLENLINNHDYIMIFSDEEFNITLERRV
jgi:FkbM family methyltransferase